MFEAGTQIGPYTIARRLGEGAMGEVYQARHRHMARDAAIKVLHADLTEDTDVLNRFFTEARATAAVRHPGIVEIFDCDIHRSGRAFIVMEYLVGEDLARRLERVGVMAGDLPAVLAIARQIAGALGAAHAVGIVHRDLKPANIFLVGQDDPVVKIVDFGVAKLMHREGGGLAQTRTGRILGTPLYMSPEQARGAKTIDQRTDVYALGCVLFEMLAGRPVFERKGPAEVIVAHMQEPAPRLASVVPGVPAPLDALVAALLAKAPDERPAAMPDVVARLQDAAAGVGSPSRVPTQVFGGGKSGGAKEAVAASQASPAVASGAGLAPAPAAVSSGAGKAPAPLALSMGTRSGTAPRAARVFPRAASTTLGDSAAELVAAAGDGPSSPARRRGMAAAGVVAILLAGGLAWLVGRAPTTRGAPATAARPSAPVAPPAAPPISAPRAGSLPSMGAPDAGSPAELARPERALVPTSSKPHRRARTRRDDGEFKAIED